MKIIAPLLCCAVLLLSGCITVDPKAQTSPLSAATTNAQFTAPISVSLVLSSADEDLRKELTGAISAALKGARIAQASTSTSTVEMKLNRFRRVSKLSRSWNGHFAGAVEYDVTLTFSTGESFRINADLGMKYGYSGTFGKTTGDGIKAIAQLVATETVKRIKSL